MWVSHPLESTKPTILRNCGLIFLSVIELIAKIFGAVSRTRKHPSETKPNVHVVRDFGADGCCKEQSDGIAIVTLCVNRVRSYSLFSVVENGNIEMKNKKEPR